ncbi:MAG: hypothetical protein II140_04630 [Paludibacteraceae bacterium]|nr:hypothetical protein [Paludibacteraceae bacterium]
MTRMSAHPSSTYRGTMISETRIIAPNNLNTLHAPCVLEPDITRHRPCWTKENNTLLLLYYLLTSAFTFPYFSRANI